MNAIRQKIGEIEELKYLFTDDPENLYFCYKGVNSTKFTHLQKCVMKTNQYPILNRYIGFYIVKNPGEIDKRNDKGLTALFLAVINSKTLCTDKTVKILLSHGANINLKIMNETTPLMFAVRSVRLDSSEETVKILLENGADVNLQNANGNTALMLSVLNTRTESSEDIVRLLLKYGANLNLTDKNRLTPLMCASRYSKTKSSIETMKILLDNGANPNEKLGNTKLIKILYNHYLKNEIDLEVIGILLMRGANYSDLPHDKNLKKILKESGFLKSNLQNMIDFINQKDVRFMESICEICFSEELKVVECVKGHKMCLSCLSKLNYSCEFCHPRN